MTRRRYMPRRLRQPARPRYAISLPFAPTNEQVAMVKARWRATRDVASLGPDVTVMRLR